MSICKENSGSWYKLILASVSPNKLTSGLRLLTSKTELAGTVVTAGRATGAGTADVGEREPSGAGTTGKE